MREQLDSWCDLAEIAQANGFDSLWVPEQFTAGEWSSSPPSALLVLAALAPRTTLGLGAGVVLLPATNPLRLAYDAALVDQLSAGRLVLGVGIGDPQLARRFGVGSSISAEWIDETLAMLRALWSGDRQFRGRYITVEGGIHPLPWRPGGPPIWVGGYVRKSVERAVTYGQGYYLGSPITLPLIERQVRRYLDALGRVRPATSATIAVNRLALVAETNSAARAAAKPHIGRVLDHYFASGSNVSEVRPSASGPEIAYDMFEEALCVVGDPETAARRLRRYRDAGITRVHLRVRPEGISFAAASRTLELVGTRVLPMLDAPDM